MIITLVGIDFGLTFQCPPDIRFRIYIFNFPQRQVYCDAHDDLTMLARYINDCRNPLGYNVKFVKLPEEKKALVVASRDILPVSMIVYLSLDKYQLLKIIDDFCLFSGRGTLYGLWKMVLGFCEADSTVDK